MTSELLQLFGEGGGLDALDKHSVVTAAGPPVASEPWLAIAKNLAMVQEVALQQQLAQALASSEAQTNADFSETMGRAVEFLQSWSDEWPVSVQLLVEAKPLLQTKFNVTPWEAYWSIMLRSFRTQVSPIGLVQSLVRELEQDAA